MAVQPIPPGYHTVTPYLIVDDAAGLLTFLEQAFAADIEERHDMPDGSVAHATVKIGTSRVMMGGAQDKYPAMPTMLYLYVEDCDATFQGAVEAGAEVVQPLKDEFYGDRVGAVKGPGGNQWWIASHVEDVDPEEMERRMAEAKGAQ